MWVCVTARQSLSVVGLWDQWCHIAQGFNPVNRAEWKIDPVRLNSVIFSFRDKLRFFSLLFESWSGLTNESRLGLNTLSHTHTHTHTRIYIYQHVHIVTHPTASQACLQLIFFMFNGAIIKKTNLYTRLCTLGVCREHSVILVVIIYVFIYLNVTRALWDHGNVIYEMQWPIQPPYKRFITDTHKWYGQHLPVL